MMCVPPTFFSSFFFFFFPRGAYMCHRHIIGAAGRSRSWLVAPPHTGSV